LCYSFLHQYIIRCRSERNEKRGDTDQHVQRFWGVLVCHHQNSKWVLSTCRQPYQLFFVNMHKQID